MWLIDFECFDLLLSLSLSNVCVCKMTFFRRYCALSRESYQIKFAVSINFHFFKNWNDCIKNGTDDFMLFLKPCQAWVELSWEVNKFHQGSHLSYNLQCEHMVNYFYCLSIWMPFLLEHYNIYCKTVFNYSFLNW